MNRYISWAAVSAAVVAVMTLVGLPGRAADPATAGAQIAQAPAPQVGPRREGDDMVLGAANAPITLIEYASLTCPHCAAFATETFPKLKSEYIDKGLMKYIYRDYPLDGAALQASMIARCAGPEKYFTFIDVFFHQQPIWVRGGTVAAAVQNLKPIARLGGMSEADFDACLKNTDVQTAVLAQIGRAHV